MSPLVVVSVGTDHHPFDRLVGWVDAWLADGAAERARCVVQYGASTAPAKVDGRDYLGHGELTRLLDEAAVVVCHGGPTTITESRRHGRTPIVVPRSPELGEHVDDHQERFCARMADKGLIVRVTEEAAFRAAVEHALRAPAEYAAGSSPDGAAGAAVERFGRLVEELLASRRAT